ncbi:MAG: flippase-like domain-containing protein, partial [Candidatus Rokubacteria bacterium]|nr:flippase-like domain-containing protein [Candidatus Rokubacteria bacterium]
MVARNDPAAVLSSLSRLSWELVIVLVLPHSLVTIFDTLGWRFAFRRDTVAFRALVPARLAGEAVNMATPTAALGGEAVKTWLLRGHVSLDESLPSVIIAKTTITIAQGVFLLFGIALAWRTLPSDSLFLHAMQWLLAVEADHRDRDRGLRGCRPGRRLPDPGRAGLGVLEGGDVATFAALGLESAAGLSFSLVRRLREALWIGIGLV